MSLPGTAWPVREDRGQLTGQGGPERKPGASDSGVLPSSSISFPPVRGQNRTANGPATRQNTLILCPWSTQNHPQLTGNDIIVQGRCLEPGFPLQRHNLNSCTSHGQHYHNQGLHIKVSGYHSGPYGSTKSPCMCPCRQESSISAAVRSTSTGDVSSLVRVLTKLSTNLMGTQGVRYVSPPTLGLPRARLSLPLVICDQVSDRRDEFPGDPLPMIMDEGSMGIPLRPPRPASADLRPLRFNRWWPVTCDPWRAVIRLGRA